MDKFPHHYRVTNRAGPDGALEGHNDAGLALESGPPPQFGGDGRLWSPEHLLTASVSSCLVLTFRAVASASALPWQAIDCQVEGTLDRVDRVTRFTQFDILVRLVAPEAAADKAITAVEKAKANCLVSNSINATFVLKVELVDSL